MSSVVEAAATVSGRFPIIHGVIDENVHMQNTLQLVQALQKAGKSFDMMLYPGNRHGIRDEKQRHRLDSDDGGRLRRGPGGGVREPPGGRAVGS